MNPMTHTGKWVTAWVNDVQKAERDHVSYINPAGPAVAVLVPKELSLSLGCSAPKTYNYVSLTP